MWHYRSLTTASASPLSVVQAWASPRCESVHPSWAVVALSSLSQRAVPRCWSVYRCLRSEKLETLRILIAEDHPLFRKGVISLISSEPGFEVIGEANFSPAIATRVLAFFATSAPGGAPPQAFPTLTDREREILNLIAQGHPNPSIARQLSLSTKTVGNYVSNIFTKLQVADRAH